MPYVIFGASAKLQQKLTADHETSEETVAAPVHLDLPSPAESCLAERCH